MPAGIVAGSRSHGGRNRMSNKPLSTDVARCRAGMAKLLTKAVAMTRKLERWLDVTGGWREARVRIDVDADPTATLRIIGALLPISRPGNSGGPIMSHDGYVVGLSIVDATGEYVGNEAFSPHYAGIPAQVVVEAVESLGLGIELQREKYE